MSDTYTQNYNLVLPAVGPGSTGWPTKLNNNFSQLDTIIKQIDDLSNEEKEQIEIAATAILQALVVLKNIAAPFEFGVIFRGTGTFNGPAGTAIPLPLTTGNPDSYSVHIIPKNESGFLGEVWVEKADSAFMVYNSGSDTWSEFEYMIVYTEYLQGGITQ